MLYTPTTRFTMSKYSIIALLPVRQAFPFYLQDRNFLPFDGQPMYRFMISKLLSVPEISCLVVDTDSDEVKAFCSADPRITVIDRPEMLRDENIASDQITAYNLQQVEGEHFIEIQSFNPLLTKFSISSAIRQYFDYVGREEHDFDSVFSMQRHEQLHYNLDTRSLDNAYPFVIFENRILHVFNRTSFKSQGNKKVGRTAMLFEVREVENTLVDSESNYELAKLVYANQKEFPAIFHSGN